MCCAVVRWKEPCWPSWSTSQCCLPRLSVFGCFPASGEVAARLWYPSYFCPASSHPSALLDQCHQGQQIYPGLRWTPETTHTLGLFLLQPTEGFGLEKQKRGHFMCNFCVRAFLRLSLLKVCMSSHGWKKTCKILAKWWSKSGLQLIQFNCTNTN